MPELTSTREWYRSEGKVETPPPSAPITGRIQPAEALCLPKDRVEVIMPRPKELEVAAWEMPRFIRSDGLPQIADGSRGLWKVLGDHVGGVRLRSRHSLADEIIGMHTRLELIRVPQQPVVSNMAETSQQDDGEVEP